MEKIIQFLIKQQTEIYELLGDDRIPKINSPIKIEDLSLIKKHWNKKGWVLPSDYEEFLKICDGIDHFSASYDLFGSKIFLSDNFDKHANDLLKNGIGLEDERMEGIVFLGWNEETTNRIFYDFKPNKVPILYDGEPGFISLYVSFEQFLNLKTKANELTIKSIREMQNEIPEDEH